MNKVKKFLYSQKAAPYVFILPFVLTVILFWVFPIANGVLLSFQDVLKDKWVGMNNYKRLLSDTYFRKAVWNSFKYMVGTLVLLIPFPMLFASMLNSKLMKAKGFFKSVYFIPALTSVVVVGTIFRLMFGEMDTFIRLFMLMDIYTSLFRNIKTETLFFCRHTYIPKFFLPGFRQMLQAMKHLFFSLLHVKKVIQRGQGII